MCGDSRLFAQYLEGEGGERSRKTNSDFPMPTLVDPTIVETAAKEKGTNLLSDMWW